jgi:hypothetical protein
LTKLHHTHGNLVDKNVSQKRKKKSNIVPCSLIILLNLICLEQRRSRRLLLAF